METRTCEKCGAEMRKGHLSTDRGRNPIDRVWVCGKCGRWETESLQPVGAAPEEPLGPLVYYVVLCRLTDRGGSDWFPADHQPVPNSYESYPVMYQTRERAERWAREFRDEGPGYDAEVVEVKIAPPPATPTDDGADTGGERTPP